jgi:hypothetical protein
MQGVLSSKHGFSRGSCATKGHARADHGHQLLIIGVYKRVSQRLNEYPKDSLVRSKFGLQTSLSFLRDVGLTLIALQVPGITRLYVLNWRQTRSSVKT